jgi:hypothetical protein
MIGRRVCIVGSQRRPRGEHNGVCRLGVAGPIILAAANPVTLTFIRTKPGVNRTAPARIEIVWRQKVAVVHRIHLPGKHDLALVVQALKRLGVRFGVRERGQQHGGQNGNSRQDDAQFNQRETGTAGWLGNGLAWKIHKLYWISRVQLDAIKSLVGRGRFVTEEAGGTIKAKFCMPYFFAQSHKTKQAPKT